MEFPYLNVMNSTLHNRWNKAVSELLLHSENDGFLDLFISELRGCLGFDQWFAVEFELHTPPKSLGYDGIANDNDEYARGSYLLDPYYSVFKNRHWPSCNRLSDISNNRSGYSEYSKTYLSKWGTQDEVGYVVPVERNTCVHFSVSRSQDLPAFSREEINFMHSITSVVGSVFYRHRLQKNARTLLTRADYLEMHDAIGQTIAAFGDGLLSDRELEISRLMLKGYCAKSLSQLLGITYGTAKNHMKNIYRKLGVSSQIEMLVLFIDELYDVT